MNLVLIGLRGTGKSTVARVLGERLGWPWFDADTEIESRSGQTIAEIFASQGEPTFRDWETRIVAELAQRPNSVLALGGGAIVRPENRQAILEQGRVAWLTASPEVLWQRVQADRATAARRPNLTSAGGINEIIATLDARRAIYQGCAHFEVDTEGKTPEEVADAILVEFNLPA